MQNNIEVQHRSIIRRESEKILHYDQVTVAADRQKLGDPLYNAEQYRIKNRHTCIMPEKTPAEKCARENIHTFMTSRFLPLYSRLW